MWSSHCLSPHLEIMFVVQQSFMGMGSVNWFQLAGLLIDDAFPSLPGLVHCDLRLGNLPPKPFHCVPFSQSGSFLDGRLRYSRAIGVLSECSVTASASSLG